MIKFLKDTLKSIVYNISPKNQDAIQKKLQDSGYEFGEIKRKEGKNEQGKHLTFL